jgi:hypothetical protein
MVIHTGLIAAPLAIWMAALGMAISRRRFRGRIGPGMTGDESFTRLQRAHGNAIEHIPLVLVLLLLLELSGASPTLIYTLGGIFVAARIAHPIGLMTRSKHPLHIGGAAATYLLEFGLGVLLLVRGLSAL